MTEKHDGGPAFPQNDLSNYNMGPDGIGDGMGMSLRDWFAGQALEGRGYDGWGAQDIAEMAYEIADAMLEARLAARTGGDA